MRHAKSRTEINRFTSWRKATIASLVRSLLIYESIRTTRRKAKLAQPLAERLVALSKQGSLAAKRRAFRFLCDHKLVSRLFSEIGPRFADRAGGYTRVLKLGRRRGDGAELAVFELTELRKKPVKAYQSPKEKETKKPHEPVKPGEPKETGKKALPEEKRAQPAIAVKETRPLKRQKPSKNFLGGLRKIFKKERDSL